MDHGCSTKGNYESFNKDYLQSPGVMNTTRNSSASFERTLNQTYNAVLNYEWQYANHTVAALAGSEFFDGYIKSFLQVARGLQPTISETLNTLQNLKVKET